MAITLVNPEHLPKTDVYHQVSVATGSKLVFIAGQVAVGADGEKVGVGDFAAQVQQAYLNVGTAPAEVGSSFADVATPMIYVGCWPLGRMPLFLEGAARAAAKLGVTPVPPGSMIGVSV